MVEVRTYTLPPTKLVPNSPMPLLHYFGFFSAEDCSPEIAFDLFTSNGWQTQWITRYGPTQASHYHSAAHECMTVLSGTATICFGAADVLRYDEDNAHVISKEPGGVEIFASVGDVFVLPAGLAHKTFDPSPAASFQQLLPGDGHFYNTSDPRTTIKNVELSGFTMIGAYPSGTTWDFMTGGEHEGAYEAVHSIARPERDPVLGDSKEGLRGLWTGAGG